MSCQYSICLPVTGWATALAKQLGEMKCAAELQVQCTIGLLFWSPGCVVSFATLGSGALELPEPLEMLADRPQDWLWDVEWHVTSVVLTVLDLVALVG
jgi:hypothetical protein